jgi:predicted nuclease of predicted toxin-antitoxin system
MTLKFLLDENISHVVATQIQNHAPEIVIQSVYFWRDGFFKGKQDHALLRAAAEENLTLVTFDQNTIPPLFFEFMQRGEDHGGVIFIDQRTISNNDVGTMVRSLMALWEERGQEDWTNQVMYLKRA